MVKKNKKSVKTFKRIDDKTKLEIVRYYVDNNLSMSDVGKKFGVSHHTVHRYVKDANAHVDAQKSKRGKVPWNYGLTKDTDDRVLRQAKTSSNLKEKLLPHDGYTKVWSEKLGKAVKEHHKIWFDNTGHWPDFKNDEQIHHVDGDKANNNFDNLVLCSTSEHSKIHKQYEQLTMELIKRKIISFDKEAKRIDVEDFLNKIKGLYE